MLPMMRMMMMMMMMMILFLLVITFLIASDGPSKITPHNYVFHQNITT